MSSGAVYERTNDVKTKLSEKEIINPILMYPTSKDFGEKLCDIFYETYNLPTIKLDFLICMDLDKIILENILLYFHN